MHETRKPAEPRMNPRGDRGEAGLFNEGPAVSGLPLEKYGELFPAFSEGRALPPDLMGSIASLSNLEKACRHVISNGGTAGADGMSVEDLSDWFPYNYQGLQQALLKGYYTPSAVLGVEIPKSGGGTRQLGIPTVIDRMVQQSIHQILSPFYEGLFSGSSYGYRINRSAQSAALRASGYVEGGRRIVVDLDLSKFFDRVNHDRLLHRLRENIKDKRVVCLIGLFLRSDLTVNGLISQRDEGTPQGGPLSPLLSNIVLDELDKELERRGHTFVRYADDVIILVGSLKAGHRVKASVSRFIEARLRLKVNESKSRVCRNYEVNFLGFSLLAQGCLGLSRESEGRFKEKVRSLTRRNRGVALKTVIGELNTYLRGWLNYFSPARMKKKLRNLESWTRRKLRCIRLKQCKRTFTLMKFLRNLGVPEWRSWLFALSGKGWWRKSGSYQAHEGMNKEWFAKQGLLSLTAYYRKVKT